MRRPDRSTFGYDRIRLLGRTITIRVSLIVAIGSGILKMVEFLLEMKRSIIIIAVMRCWSLLSALQPMEERWVIV